MIKENTPLEFALGTNNFRREYTGTVNTLTRIPPINPVLEPLTQPETFNKRFKQLSESVKYAYNAVGDIAIRDKRYLETFLTGYSNPFITQSFKYPNPDVRKNVNIYDPNGNPIKFPEDRIAYTIDFTGSVNFASLFSWVFIDGRLADKTKYDIINTAYGLRCFVKAEFIKANTEVSVVLNRLFNTTGKFESEITVTKAANTFSALFPVDKFGTFYDIRYLKVGLNRASSSLKRTTVPDRNVIFELDVTGNTVRMDIIDFPLAVGDKLTVVNCINPFYIETTLDSSSSKSWDDYVFLSTGGAFGYKTALDFDVFLDGYKLIPFKHYEVIEDGADNTNTSGSILRLLCERKPGNTANAKALVQIFKNESSGYRDGADIAHAEKLDCSGLYVRPANASKIPFMTRIGHATVGGKYVPNSAVTALQRSVLSVDPTRNQHKDFTFQSRVVRSVDITAIIDHSQRNFSEFDLALVAVGEQHVMDNYKAAHPCLHYQDDPDDLTVEERFASWIIWPNKKTQGDIANLTDVMEKRTNKTETLILDANSPETLQMRPELALFFNTGLMIDANETIDTDFTYKRAKPVLDANETI